jgi:hypothetical protein
MTMSDPVQKPPRAEGRLPRLYLTFAHLCLLAACAALALAPRSVAGFYYHPKMIAVVHLVTLGWISASILGSLYLISPMTLGIALPRRRLDGWAFWLYVIGTLGMTTHFWLDEPRGMVWSAALVIAAFAWVTGRVGLGLSSARLPPELKLHFLLAFGNLALAAALGFAVGLDKFLPVLPGRSLTNVLAHAHLAALGWVLMLVMGAGYRLLPMLLPAAPPRGLALWLGGSLLEVGVLGLAWGLLAESRFLAPFGACALLALGIFIANIGWMLRHRRPPARHLRHPDYAVRQIFAAVACLAAAAGLGGLLLLAPDAAWKPAVAMAYGTLGLLGFFGQMIAGVAARLLPIRAYLDAPTVAGCSRASPPPAALPSHTLERLVFWLWVPAVPVLAVALALDWIAGIRLAATSLGAGVLCGLVSHALIVRRAAGRS